MTIPASAQAPAPEARRRRLWPWIAGVLLGAFVAVPVWDHFALRRAQAELLSAGFRNFESTSMIDRIRQRPSLLLQPVTLLSSPRWRGKKLLSWNSKRGPRLRNLDSVASAIRHVHPDFIELTYCDSLQDVDGLKGLTDVKWLTLEGCTALQNVDGIEGMAGLESLTFNGCAALQSIRAMKGLSGLQTLRVDGCVAIQNVDDLKGLTRLRSLKLLNCTALQNVSGLDGLTGLQEISLNGCTGLQNVDGLKKLTGLRAVSLIDCFKLSDSAVRDLRSALPATKILFRGLSESQSP